MMIIKSYEIHVNKKIIFPIKRKKEKIFTLVVWCMGAWAGEERRKYFN